MVVGYIGGFAALILVIAIVQGPGDWTAVGGVGTASVSYVFWSVVITPVLALWGAVIGLAGWVAMRLAPRSVWLPAATAAVVAGGTTLAMVTMYVQAEVLLGNALAAVGVGLLAAAITIRDVRGLHRRDGFAGE